MENNRNKELEQRTCKYCNKAFVTPVAKRAHIKRDHKDKTA